jgi:hypothetical protein
VAGVFARGTEGVVVLEEDPVAAGAEVGSVADVAVDEAAVG